MPEAAATAVQCGEYTKEERYEPQEEGASDVGAIESTVPASADRRHQNAPVLFLEFCTVVPRTSVSPTPAASTASVTADVDPLGTNQKR